MNKNRFLFGCTFFYSLSSNILVFSMVYLLTDRFSFSPGQVGVYAAIGQLSYFTACNLYHRFGTGGKPSRIIPRAVIVAFLSSLVIGYVRDHRAALAAYGLIQGSMGFFWPPLRAWFTQGLNEKELNRDISVFNCCWMTGNLLGPLISGALYYRNSQFNFLAINLGYVLVFSVLMLLHRRSRENPAAGTGAALAEEKAGTDSPDQQEEISGPRAGGARGLPAAQAKILNFYRYRGWIGAFCSNAFVGMLMNVVPLHIRDGLGFTERAAGLVIFFRGVSALLAFMLLARFTFWHFNRRWFIFIQSGLVFCALLFLIARGQLFIYFLVSFLYGFCNAGSYNNSIFHSSATGKNPRKNLALHEIFLSTGNAAGAAGGGLCYQQLGFGASFLVLALVLGLGLGAFVLIDGRTPAHTSAAR